MNGILRVRERLQADVECRVARKAGIAGPSTPPRARALTAPSCNVRCGEWQRALWLGLQ
jgi:hypothetical protein